MQTKALHTARDTGHAHPICSTLVISRRGKIKEFTFVGDETKHLRYAPTHPDRFSPGSSEMKVSFQPTQRCPDVGWLHAYFCAPAEVKERDLLRDSANSNSLLSTWHASMLVFDIIKHLHWECPLLSSRYIFWQSHFGKMRSDVLYQTLECFALCKSLKTSDETVYSVPIIEFNHWNLHLHWILRHSPEKSTAKCLLCWVLLS